MQIQPAFPPRVNCETLLDSFVTGQRETAKVSQAMVALAARVTLTLTVCGRGGEATLTPAEVEGPTTETENPPQRRKTKKHNNKSQTKPKKWRVKPAVALRLK